jgi:hypothetical protein
MQFCLKLRHLCEEWQEAVKLWMWRLPHDKTADK